MLTIKGNLLNLASEGEFDIIVHNCNCHCIMSGETSVKLASVYPKTVKADSFTGIGNLQKLGTWSEATARTSTDDTFKIFNAYVQFVPGRDARLSAITTVFEKINMMYPGAVVGIPMVSEHDSGLSWRKVKKEISKVTPDISIIIVK